MYIYFPTSVLGRLQVLAGRGLLSAPTLKGPEQESEQGRKLRRMRSRGDSHTQAQPRPHLCPVSGPDGKSISVADSDTRSSFMLQKSCLLLLLQKSIHTFLRLKTHPRLVVHSSGLLDPADAHSHHQGLRSHLRHWSSVILSGADTSSWHSRPSSVLITPWPPPASIFRKGIAQEHWIRISHQSDIVVNLSSHSSPAVTRRLGTCGNLWLIS